MKTFTELSATQQKSAVDRVLNDLVRDICAGAIRFNDKLNHDNLQRRIDRAIKKADRLQTPWFAPEYVLEACREDLEGMARCTAEDAVYPEAQEVVLIGIL